MVDVGAAMVSGEPVPMTVPLQRSAQLRTLPEPPTAVSVMLPLDVPQRLVMLLEAEVGSEYPGETVTVTEPQALSPTQGAVQRT